MKILSVKNKLLFIFLLFSVLAVINFFIIRYFQAAQKTDAAVIDAAGRNRMLSQQLGFYAERIIHGDESSKETAKSIIMLHNISLYALKDGGVAPEIAGNRILPPTITAILPIVQKTEELWLEYKRNGEIIINEPVYIDGVQNPAVSNALKFIENNAPEMLRRNNELVKAYEELNDEKHTQMDRVLLILLTINVVIFGSGGWFATSLARKLEELTEKNEVLINDLEKFKMAAEYSSDMVLIADKEGIALYANPATERITGYSIKEIIGVKCGALWGKHMEQAFYKEMWQTIKVDKKPFISNLRNERKNGELFDMAIFLSPILDQKGNILFLLDVARDITKEVEIDKAKTEFVSLASHQLRTPLGISKWYLEALKEDDLIHSDLKRSQEYIDEVYNSNERLIKLVGDLLNVSRIEQSKVKNEPVMTDVLTFIKTILKQLEVEVEKKGIKIALLDKTENLLKLNIDQERFREVLENLISNAIKYTDRSGQVEITVSSDKNKLQADIKDNGMGIAKEDQSKIFTRFFRTTEAAKKDTSGSGLGLYIVKSYIEGWGGKIWFESEEGKGSTFHFSLPLKLNT